MEPGLNMELYTVTFNVNVKLNVTYRMTHWLLCYYYAINENFPRQFNFLTISYQNCFNVIE